MTISNIIILCVLTATTSITTSCGPSYQQKAKSQITDASPIELEVENTTVETGGHREILNDDGEHMRVAYKVPAKSEVFTQFKKNLENSIDTKLSESISDAVVILFDKNNQPYDAALEAQNQNKKSPAYAEIQISLRETGSNNKINKLIFKSQLEIEKNKSEKAAEIASTPSAKNISLLPEVSASNTTSNAASNTNSIKPEFTFKSDLLCHDETCQLIEIRLKKYAQKNDHKTGGNPLGEAGILYQHSKKQVHIPKAVTENPSFDSGELNDLAKRIDNVEADINSFAVVNGEASSHIEIPNLYDARVPMLDTSETASPIENAEIKSDNHNNANIKNNLIGHNQANGNIAIEAVDPNSDESLLLLFEDKFEDKILVANANDDGSNISPPTKLDDPKLDGPLPKPKPQPKPLPQSPVQELPIQDPPSKQQPTEQKPIEPPPPVVVPRPHSVSIFKQSLDPALLPEAARVSRGFGQYANHREVQRMIRVLLGKEKNQKTCQIGQYTRPTIESFIKYTPNIAPYIENITEKIDVTPEIGYLLFIESSYSKSAKYPATQAGSAQDIGPWQITTDTAKFISKFSGIQFNVFSVLNRNVNLMDDRTYFMNSTYMASILLKSLFKTFKNDPALAILSYNIGQGGTQKGVSKVFARNKKLNVTLAEIYDYKIQSNSHAVPCERVNYAFTFLAARIIGQNLDLYDLDKIEPYTGKEFMTRLARPGGPLPAGITAPPPLP